MHDGEDEELLRIRENLLGRRAENGAAGADLALKKNDDLESGLRALGLNRRERERWRRRGNDPRPRNGDRDRAIAVKRIDHHIGELVDWTTAGASRAEVVAAWAHLSNHDVDRVKKWLDKGVDPLRFAEVMRLVDNGLRTDDLFAEVHGKTIAQHLRDGSSVEWCLHALYFKRERDASMRPQLRGSTPSGQRAS
ncbi:hypothetical protein [Micromonospora sp. AKA38]|uniref:hypothetical protein n=1 Tax=Micromonospora sp. AKA38 TaxID=2733861 RepID=UPI0022BDCE86|nr:hypothetical protein [Micromonospora sp. AKA38]GHJ12158.1 hypothetical protein TPA0908_01530 [Micromonospora sp. AKA38]